MNLIPVRRKFRLETGVGILLIVLLYSCSKSKDTPLVEEPRFFSPTGLKAIVANDSTLRISWKDNSNVETGFQVQRKAGNESFKLVKETAANDTVYMDLDVVPNILYVYRVRAIGKTLETGYSDEVSAKLDLPIPVLSYILLDDTAVKLEWTDNSALESSFILERSKDNQPFTKFAELDRNVKTFTDATIEINASYRYRVKAKNKSTETLYSNLVTAKVNFEAPVISAILPGGNVISLSWTDASQFEKGFTVEQSIDDGSYSELVKLDSTKLSFAVQNLQPSKKYAFRVKAHSTKNNSAYSKAIRIFYQDKRYAVIESYTVEATSEGQMAISPSGNLIATANYFTGNVKIIHRDSKTTTNLLTGHTEGGFCVMFSRDNTYLLTSGSKDGSVKLWNA